MAILGGDVLTLADMAKRTENGMPALIAEVLNESNGILSDIPWKASNRPYSNITTTRTGLPTVYLRRLNEGSVSSKSTTAQTEDGMSLLDAWSTVDKKLIELEGNKAAALISESYAFIEAMGQTAAGLLFYGSVADDEKEFNGFAVRPQFSALGNNALGAGGSTTTSSIWLIKWHPEKVFGQYPKHLKGGLQHEDHGQQIIQTDDDLGGRKLTALVSQWMWDMGLVVKDPRNVVRIANIEHQDVVGVTGTQELLDYTTNIMFLMARATHRIAEGAGNLVFYMPRTVLEGLDVQALARSTGVGSGMTGLDGNGPLKFRGIPIKIVDQLIYTEAAIS